MKKTILISIIVIIAIVVGILAAKPFGRKEKPAPEAPKAEVVPSLPAKEDSTAAINQTLEEIETIDLDKEFQAIDADLQNL